MNTIFSPAYLKFSFIIISLISAFSISGGGDDYSYWSTYNSNVAPEAIVQDKTYEPLFYSANMFYGNNSYLDEHSYRFVNNQVDEWNDYLQNDISKEKLKLIIGTDSLNTVVSELCKKIKNNKTNSLDKEININNPKIKEFLVFINLAKSIEKNTNFSSDWNYDTDSYNVSSLIPTPKVKEIEKTYTITKNNFLIEKYWFLTLKAYFYSENQKNAVSFFQATESKIEKSISYYRGLSYIAGINHKNGNFALSNYQFAQIFENCPILRKEAIYNFKPKETSDFKQALSLTKTIQEKCALWALYGFYADPVEAINSIYNLDPKNKHLPYLLSRAINLEENNLNETDFRQYSTNSIIKNESIDASLYETISKIANNNNTINPYNWHVVLAYLETIKGNYTKATSYLNEAKKTAPENNLIQNQIKLFTVFNQVSKVKVLNTDSENSLIPHLNWLFNYTNSLSNENYNNHYEEAEYDDENKLRTDFLVSWSRSYISNLYKKQNNSVMAELFSREKNFYNLSDNITKMQKYFIENKQTNWDKLAQSLYNVTLDDIYEYKGILFAYKNQIDKAIIEFKKSNKSELLGANPFNGKIKDCHQCDYDAIQKTQYTKLSFLEKIKEIQTNLSIDTDGYSGNLLLGNAFYNISYYGNGRFFYNNPIIDQNTNYIDEEYNDLLYGSELAEMYYKNAFKAAKDDEEKAKSTYLLTKIERNNFYYTEKFKPGETDYILFNGYKKLMVNYSKTKYYSEVIKECGYFRNVVNY